MPNASWDHTVDFLVVGSGGGGMTAALVAAHAGLEVLVIEKTPYFGGSTARSGGGLWIPNNHLLARDGVHDSLDMARTYMAHTVGDRTPKALQEAYLIHAPRMILWLEEHTPVIFQRMPGYADYYPERPGGLAAGRSLEPVPFDGRKLGDELAYLRKPMAEAPGGLAFTSSEYRRVGMMMTTWEGKKTVLRVGLRWLANLLQGVTLLTMGQALSARLRYAMMQAGIPLWLNAPFLYLITEEGRVTGARVRRDGREMSIRARRGVLLAAGGFPHNLDMRRRYLPAPTSTDWTVACDGNTGDAIRAGMALGAAVDLMDDAWWGPSSKPPGEPPFFHVAERAYPGSIMVNGLGQRFINESAPYIDVVHTMYALHSDQTPHIPAWFLFDERYRRRYLFGAFFPIAPIPKRYFANGYILREDTLEALAERMGVAPAALLATVARFNEFARSGVDEDFHRGESAYDNYYGDPTVQPNPNLAPLDAPPFYAVRMWPGDLGTKGGLVTDAWARVLRTDGSPIPGLYATGNAMASIMGNSYPGAGATIGPSMTFGYLAARRITGEINTNEG